jgi:hypothetical protein
MFHDTPPIHLLYAFWFNSPTVAREARQHGEEHLTPGEKG